MNRMNWRSRFYKASRMGALLVSAVLLAVMLGGCNIIALGQAIMDKQKADETFALTSSDGQYQLTLPGDWSDAGSTLNDQAILAACNLQQEKYVVVIAESRADFYEDVTVQDYMELLVEQMGLSIQDMRETPMGEVSVGGRTGYLSRLDGAIDGYEVTYWLTCVETSSDFVQITGWTLQSMADECQQEFYEIETSFAEIV
ncbi:MAG TPA: hypothetical protein H9674_04070 [Firmicutes bacterium]|nr:hypothetical protein [Bacillota bacterium]